MPAPPYVACTSVVVHPFFVVKQKRIASKKLLKAADAFRESPAERPRVFLSRTRACREPF
jgi:hypothetical protein